jgi:hypothetical protein
VSMTRPLETAAQLSEVEARRKLQEFEDAEQRIRPPDNRALPWRPHEGPPHTTPEIALALYRQKRSDALARNVMTDEQCAAFVGDAKAS